MRSLLVPLAATALVLASSAEAAVKLYDASIPNGAPGDNAVISADICPPVQATPGSVEGHSRINDDSLGTVTLEELTIVQDNTIDVGPDRITTLLGPGAFFFSDRQTTTFTTAPHVSNTTGIGSFGPSSTAPGSGAEWGIVSGWGITGFAFCISSPTQICAQANASHGQTIPTVLASPTYDLGTWSFDAEGDMEGSTYIYVTANGGITNGIFTLRGAFHGASLPALPLLGFGALASGLLLIGVRSMRGQR